ncbi:MAG: hypothetical protein IMY69_03615 [Bacteroidetes bacterium]|nr:hypothetical protein [Bacteroidota bacterium]
MEELLYDFISLNVKCPVCKKSFMGKETLVDGKPGIKLNIEISKNKGTIYLSSIYESYNYRCDIELIKGEIAKFTCPNCLSEITSKIECEDCNAQMISFLLDIGGKANICSRIGCKSHFLEIDDISSTLKKLYHLGDFKGPLPEGIEETGESKEIIESGTYLHTYCPHCNKSLIEKGLVKLKISKENEEIGFIFLSPYLNVFTSKSTVVLPEEHVVGDIKCFHCNTSLIDKNEKCGECGSPAAKIAVSARTKFIDFYICSKKGCRWHGLDEDDLHDIELEDSLEW